MPTISGLDVIISSRAAAAPDRSSTAAAPDVPAAPARTTSPAPGREPGRRSSAGSVSPARPSSVFRWAWVSRSVLMPHSAPFEQETICSSQVKDNRGRGE